MTNINYKLTADLQSQQPFPRISAKRGDTGRQLQIQLIDQGQPYRISPECYAVFTAQKPDGNIIYNACTISGDLITYTFTAQTCAAVGELLCELKLYGGDNKLITSPRFSIIIEEAVYSEGDPVESASEVQALTALVSEATSLITDVEQKLADNAYAEAHSAVCFTAQSLEDAQKAQARTNIGAAPSGFGLGTVARSVSYDDLDTLTATGWYRFDFGAVTEFEGLHFRYGLLEVIGYTDNLARQFLYVGSSGSYTLTRQKIGGVWYDWYCADAPMVVGMEYRTAERYQGKAVYAKLIDFGALPNASTKSVSTGTSAASIVSFEGIATNSGGTRYHFPLVTSGNLVAFTYIGSGTGSVCVATTSDLSAYTAYFMIKFIKD